MAHDASAAEQLAADGGHLLAAALDQRLPELRELRARQLERRRVVEHDGHLVEVGGEEGVVLAGQPRRPALGPRRQHGVGEVGARCAAARRAAPAPRSRAARGRARPRASTSARARREGRRPQPPAGRSSASARASGAGKRATSCWICASRSAEQPRERPGQQPAASRPTAVIVSAGHGGGRAAATSSSAASRAAWQSVHRSPHHARLERDLAVLRLEPEVDRLRALLAADPLGLLRDQLAEAVEGGRRRVAGALPLGDEALVEGLDGRLVALAVGDPELAAAGDARRGSRSRRCRSSRRRRGGGAGSCSARRPCCRTPCPPRGRAAFSATAR